jgi:predicted RNA polymerase sigma factor
MPGQSHQDSSRHVGDGQTPCPCKDKIRQAGIPFRIPEREELVARLDAVLEAIYAAFAEGWTDPGGTDLSRRSLTGKRCSSQG